MKRWKIKVRMVGLLDRQRVETVEVSADTEHAASCLAVYVAAGLFEGFKSYEPIEAVHQDDPRFHQGNGSLAA